MSAADFVHKTDYADEAVRLLYRRYRTARTVCFAKACAYIAQKVEDDIALIIGATLDTATGELLARYGRLVGIYPTETDSDDTYRRLIRAKILANISNGTRYDLREVVARLMNVPIESVRAWGLEAAHAGPAVVYAATLGVGETMPTDAGGALLADLLDTARPAGEALDFWIAHPGGFVLGSSELGDGSAGLARILRPSGA